MKDVKLTTKFNGNNTAQKIDNKYIISMTDPGYYSSVMINRANFIEDEIFILSFFAKKIDGNVISVGGHSTSYKTHEVYLDGEKQNSKFWNTGIDYPNDNKTHFLQVVLSLNASDHPDRNIYIQPNRREGFRESCDIEISNIEILNLKDKYEISNHFNGQSHIGYLRDDAVLGSENIIDYNWRAL